MNATSLKVLRADGTPEASGRDDGGRFCSIIPAIHRFGKRLEFDAHTGCVMWRGGTTHGRGHSAPYGSFWDQGKRWFAHRWAAKYIHGLNIDGYQVDHCCPNTGGRPNTLCVEHLQAVTFYEHVALEQRRNNIYIQVGLLEAEPLYEPRPDAPPFFLPPSWFAKLRREIARPLESDMFREVAACSR